MKEKLKFLLDIIFIFSIPFLSLLLCGNYELKYMKILIILSFLVGIFLKLKILKRNIYQDINKNYFIFSILYCLYIVGLLKENTGNNVIIYVHNLLDKFFKITINVDLIKNIISFLSIFSLVFIVYYLIQKIYPFLKREYKNLEKIEKDFLILIIFIGFISTTIIYYKTNAFYKPIYNQENVYTNIIYTSDTGLMYSDNVYLSIGAGQNDIRQPLFGVFSIPFASIAKFISLFLSFIPNNYYVIFNTIQIFLLGLSFVLVEKMLELKTKDKLLFLILSACTYPTILFSFASEQYIISLFYLILAIYIGYSNKVKINYCYIGAVGTLLTSGIIFPLISRFKNFKYWIKNIINCFIFFCIIEIISGQFIQIFNFTKSFNNLMNFSGKNLFFIDKLKQFLYFIQSLFIAPSGIITQSFKYGITYPTYQLIKVNFISTLGILILLLCIASYILNRKNKFALICFLWIIFSFILLCIVGWGTQENGLILYSLYFSWAYISLIYLLYKKIKNTKTRKILFYIIICVMLYFNIGEFYNLLHFLILNYN